MTRFRNRITGDDCRMTGEVDVWGLVGVKYEDDERTFFISRSRLVPVSDVLGEQLTEVLPDPFGDAVPARAATPSGLSQSALASCQHRIAIARKSA